MLNACPLAFNSLAIGVASATVGLILTPVLAPPILGVVGFGAAGPVAGEPRFSLPDHSPAHTNNVGTMAAGIQAGIGNVVAGSLFATAQSVAMGGALPVAVTAIGAGVAGIGGAAAGATSAGARVASVGVKAASAVRAGIGAAAVAVAAVASG